MIVVVFGKFSFEQKLCFANFHPGGLSERFQHKLQDFGRSNLFLRQNATGSSMGRAVHSLMENASDLRSEHCGFKSRQI